MTQLILPPTPAVPNRYPYLPVPAGAWYGSAGATPSGWVLPGAWSVSYTAPRGFAQLSVPGAATAALAYLPISVMAQYQVVARLRVFANGDIGGLGIGFSAGGTPADFAGAVYDGGSAWRGYTGGAPIWSIGTGVGQYVGVPWFYVWTVINGGNVSIRVSSDGYYYDQVIGWPTSLTPTKLGILVNARAIAAAQCVVVLDYLSFGAANPLGQ